MADNPLKPDSIREQRIRERAYQLWEQDGRPHGRDWDHWERARTLIASEDGAGPVAEPPAPKPRRSPRKRKATATEPKAPATEPKPPTRPRRRKT